VVDGLWRPIAREQLERRRQLDEPVGPHLTAPPVSRRVRRILGPLDGLVVDA
jgi:hypothetical protein